jgi:hypothetical protein
MKYTLQSYRKRLRRLQGQLTRTDDVVQKTAIFGAKKAIENAPIDTGALINSIVWKKSKDSQAWIVQRNPSRINPKMNDRSDKGRNFNYAWYMYQLANGKANSLHNYNLKRGRLDYMQYATFLTGEKFGINVRGHVRNAIRNTR